MAFVFKNNKLWIENGGQSTAVSEAAKHPTPFYLYDLEGLRQRLKAFKAAFKTPVQAHFAMKSNNQAEILKVFLQEGFGVDIVSSGEMKRALEIGFSPKQIVFSGVAKTVAEIDAALDQGIFQINVESLSELKRIDACAKKKNKKAAIALRINPDVYADTHPHIRTGYRDNKFGIDISDLPQFTAILKNNANIQFQGLTVHIGSQIMDLQSLQSAFVKAVEVHQGLLREGFQLTTLDVGGGLGIHYDQQDESAELDLLKKYGQLVDQIQKEVNVKVICEPGRFLVARCGVLITEIQYVKKTPYKNFVIVDTGMHHLMRPSLYQAFHRIHPLNASDSSEGAHALYDVVGPICESTDVLARDRQFTGLREGDRLAIMDAGAYGAVMANSYNLHAPVTEHVVKKS